MKRFVLTVILISILTACFTPVFAMSVSAGAISSVERLDMSDNRIISESTGFQINLSSIWANYLSANREKLKKPSELLEKINFYYEPQDKLLKPILLMTIYIYEKAGENNIKQRKVLETTDFIFAVESADANPFNNVTDKALFERFLQEAADDIFVSSLIKVPFPYTQVLSNAIFVNGNRIKGETFTAVNGVVYLPIREAAEALGYSVSWLANDRVVTVTGHGVFYSFSADGKIPNPDYTTFMYNEKTYVPSLFFIQVLKANVEIDERKNVFMGK